MSRQEIKLLLATAGLAALDATVKILTARVNRSLKERPAPDRSSN